MAYACINVTASANEDVIKKIYKILNEEYGVFNTKFSVRFIGFETDPGVAFKLNKIANKVPSTGYFITLYNGEYYITINSLTFDNGCNGIDFYIIY